jgi:hypothetical protein
MTQPRLLRFKRIGGDAMATFTSPLTEVKTQSAAVVDKEAQELAEKKRLEYRAFLASLSAQKIGGVQMIAISVRKSQNGRDLRAQHTNTYLMTGGGVWNSDAMIETAKWLAASEQKIYSTLTFFLYATISNLDSNLKVLRGQTVSEPLEYSGLFAIPANDKLAPANVVAAFDKRSGMGRSGVTLYRHCTTSEEFDQYTKTRAIPYRFKDPDDLADALRTNFTERLMNLTGGVGVKLALPDAYGDATNAPRPIKAINFAGFRSNQPYRQKSSAKVSRYQAVQKQINEWAADARFASRVDKNGAIPDRADGIVNGLKAQGTTLYNQQTPEIQSRIVWPVIFDDNPLTGGA